MKTITPIVLAGFALALCGCSTDSPIFSNDATKAKANTEEASDQTAETSRDIVNTQHSGASEGTDGAMHTGPAMSANPYAH